MRLRGIRKLAMCKAPAVPGRKSRAEMGENMDKSDKIYVAGHRGMVGSAIVRNLQSKGYSNIVGRSHKELDLTSQADVTRHDFQVKKLLFLGSTCIYPRMAPQPIPEDALLTGPLEETNEAYAIAKIAGLEMCKYFRMQYGDDFISCMPTNLYGPYDNFDLQDSHVLPAMLRKFHEAKVNGAESVELWGTGSPLREFLYVDDMADACVFLLENYSGEQHVNIGTGKEVRIKDLAKAICKTVGFEGKIVWNQDMPDGTPRKLTSVDKLHAMGWQHKVELEEGVELAYKWFKENIDTARMNGR